MNRPPKLPDLHESHTPGPWKWYRSEDPEKSGRPELWNALEHDPMTSGVSTVLTYCITNDDVNTAQVQCSPANARLIAAAPDLLTVCRALLLAWDREELTVDLCRSACGNIEKDLIEPARAAIAEAEGRP